MVVSDNAKSGPDVTRDLDRVAADGRASRKFPAVGELPGKGVPVVVKRSVCSAIHEHGHSRTDVEVCGVLVGNCYSDEGRRYVYVEAMVRGNHADSGSSQVTFTAETWACVQEVMEREFPDKRVVGWYHTHPGFGVFLSPMDLFIHENFFSGPDQVAIVYDPLGGKEGLFVWRKGEAAEASFLIEEDVVEAAAPAAETGTQEPGLKASPTAAGDGSPPIRGARRGAKLWWRLWIGLALALLAAIAAALYVRYIRDRETQSGDDFPVSVDSRAAVESTPSRTTDRVDDHRGDNGGQRPEDHH